VNANLPSDSISQRSNWVRPERLQIAALTVILTIAVVLRFWGIHFGFPEHVRPDEQYYVNAIQHCDRLNTLDPDWFYYPSFYTYLNLAVWRGYTLYQFSRGNYQVPDPTRRQSPGYGLELIRARSPNIEFLLGRCMTACFGVGTVLLVFGITRRFYGRKAAVAAAFLLAVNGLHTLNSHFYKSDVATTFFTVAVLVCMAHYVQCCGMGILPMNAHRQDACATKWNIGAAICSGLATSTNYYGGFLLVPLLVSQFMASYKSPEMALSKTKNGEARQTSLAAAGGITLAVLRALGKGLIRWETYAMPAIALATFVATSPYCFIRWTAFLDAFHRMLFSDRQSLYDTLVRQINFRDYGFQQSSLAYSILFCFRHSMGPILALVSAVGLVFLATRRRAVGWLILLFFLVHFLMTASGKAIFMRYYLSLVPILTIATGTLLSWAAQRIKPNQPQTQNLVVAAALVVCGFGSFWTSLQEDRLLARQDTRVEAREWLAKNLPANAAVGTPLDWWGNYYPYGKPALPGGRAYIPVQPNQVRAQGVRYLVLDDSLLRLYSPPRRPGWSEWLASNAQLVHEVSPYNRPDERLRARYDQLDAFYLPVARFGGIRRPGPRIRIYAVRP